LTGVATSGCRVNEDDIHRWESTAHGPDKLKAVLYYDKYDNNLRVEAALSLIRMKPRAGRRIGINIMVDTLASIAPEPRQAIVASLVPAIIAELKKPPPAAQAGQASPPDASFAYKDAAFAMLTHDGTVIVSDEGLKQSLKATLVEWAMADFEHRLENRTQAYGMEQLLRFIGPAAVAGLPKLMTRDAQRLDQMSGLVAELGDEKSKVAASAALVSIAQWIASDDWLKAKTPELTDKNRLSKLEPTPAQFKAQLAQWQDEELTRLFGSMRKVGQRPIIDFCLDFAAKKEQSERRRQAALAALEARLDRNNPDDIKRVLAIASSDAPDIVLDQAFKRLGELPREQVVDKLYELYKTDKWKVRRAAAMTVLKMSTVKNIDEFMSKLPEGGAAKGFAMPEALAYGAGLGDLKDGKPLDALRKYFTSGGASARASALSYWFSFGTTADLPQVQSLESDGTKVPVCEADECKWSCEVAKEGAKDPAKERENKDIKTIGDFVKYCIEPAMKERQPETPKK
jgi:HEAT repeat protein